MDLFDNIWIKRIVSFLCCTFSFFLAWLGYMSVFYKAVYVNKPAFVFIYLAINFFFLGIMLFSRKQPFTSLLTMLNMILIIPIVLMNFGDWFFIVPPALAVLITFFACGASESLKTVLGTVYLLIYIVSGLGFFIFTNLFMTSTSNTYTLIEKGFSPSGIYRYYIYDVADNSGGRTEVYVEPNDKDKDFGFVKFQVNGYAQRKYNVRNHEKPTVEWRDGETLYINGERYEIKKWHWEFALHSSMAT
ncbi:MAG: hypothetical protein PWQ76_638 [Clostridiales bacterium]|nr:hypothetical protein [Oscillospiraceae bacterium]MDN5378383.1 hypothetical protein [Clostridiales bacterium]